jgi:AcrR family transcriptional regulator
MDATPTTAGFAPLGDFGMATDPRIARSRQKLLDAATALLVEGGPAAVTVDAVSERSGVAKSTLYRHWPSRTDLLVGVMRAHLPVLEAPDLSVGFAPALAALLARVADTFADPEWASILPALIALQQHQPELTELFEEDRRAHMSVLDEVLRVGVSEGVLP